jgi:hypothetical protein
MSSFISCTFFVCILNFSPSFSNKVFILGLIVFGSFKVLKAFLLLSFSFGTYFFSISVISFANSCFVFFSNALNFSSLVSISVSASDYIADSSSALFSSFLVNASSYAF